jgi:serine/tyrosine/threonine adenylyltransferase
MQKVLQSYSEQFDRKFFIQLQLKLGLHSEYESDFQDELITLLTTSETDMTFFYRTLSNVLKTDTPAEALDKVATAFYTPNKIVGVLKNSWLSWMESYLTKINLEVQNDAERKTAMNAINPKYVLRNYMAQLAIEAAEKSDYSVIDELYTLLKNPYNEQPQYEKWFAKRPDWARHKVGCSMLSCSS